MNVRQTSIQTYHAIKESGLLSRRRWQCYDIVFSHGPCTANQAWEHMVDCGYISRSSNANVVTRLGELRDMGVVREVEVTRCPVTGQSVILWDVTDRMPVTLPKKETNKQIIKRLEHRLHGAVLFFKRCEEIFGTDPRWKEVVGK